MAKRKKSRKIGLIGVRKTDAPRPEKKSRNVAPEGKGSKTKGNKSGSRQNIAESIIQAEKKKKLDPKVGSKTPINLDAYKPGAKKVSKAAAPKEVKYKTPQAELEAIENNIELEQLLEKQLTKVLSPGEQAYVNKLTARYQVLCELLGIEMDVDEDGYDYEDTDYNEQSKKSNDPFDSLDAIKLEDFED